MSQGFRCATAARRRGDSMAGTAAPAVRWLLVEYAGPWATHALDSHGLAGPVGTALHRAALAARGRTLLVRRPGRRRVEAVQRWGVLDQGGRQHWGQWARPAELLLAADLLRHGLSAPGPEQDPVLLVCAHALHDTCCAIRGRPVAQALGARWPELTWECTHVGGDRFAANLLVVPDGTCYGRLDAATAVDVVESHLDGVVSVDHLRGSSLAPPPAQAALVEAHRRFGPAGPRDLTVRSCRQTGTSTFVVLLTGRRGIPDLRAEVVRIAQPPAPLTCRADGEVTAYQHVVASLVSAGRADPHG